MVTRPRARDLGIQIGPIFSPGKLNAITDVPRVKVGLVEEISGQSSDSLVRSGVTLVGTDDIHVVPLFAGIDSLQPSGELTGTLSIQDNGLLDSFIAITGTQEVGAVHTALHRLQQREVFGPLAGFQVRLPVVGETYDRMTSPLSFPNLSETQVKQAYESMSDGPVREGNSGGGTPMVSFGLKGGTGTSSRVIPAADGSTYTVGVLLQANHGVPFDLMVDGVAVGRVLYDEGYTKPWFPSSEPQEPSKLRDGDGSIIVIVATDAPLLPHQCRTVARRAGVGIARGGGGVSVFSGDIFLCFSTARPLTAPPAPSGTRPEPVGTYTVEAVDVYTLDSIYRAAADATEEAILNALLAADELDGHTGQRWRTLPAQRVKELLQKAGKIP